jgi:hypothetical protein
MISWYKLWQPLVVAALGAVVSIGHAAPYSATGTGSSLVGPGQEYTKLSDACAAIPTAGSRDSSTWTFYITGNITETANCNIMCCVDPAGSITFKPSAGVRPTITFPNTIPANVNASGNIVIGASIAIASWVDTNNLIFDGSNIVGGTTRDLTVTNANGSLEGGVGVFRIRGNCDNITLKNMYVTNLVTASSSPRCVEFTSDFATPSTNKHPDNWTVDNCSLTALSGTTGGMGVGVQTGTAGTVATGTAQTGYIITNNFINCGGRGIFLACSGSGTITGNRIRVNMTQVGLASFGIFFFESNGVSGGTLDITNNIFDRHISGQNAAGTNGPRGIGFEANTV